MDIVTVRNRDFAGFTMQTENSVLLAIRAEHGFIACGYINVETADKLDEAVAIVTGVGNYVELLQKPVVAASKKAAAAGVSPGMSGEEALLRFAD